MVRCRVTWCCRNRRCLASTFLSESFIPWRYGYLENSHNEIMNKYSARTLSRTMAESSSKTIEKLNSTNSQSLLLYCIVMNANSIKACTCQSCAPTPTSIPRKILRWGHQACRRLDTQYTHTHIQTRLYPDVSVYNTCVSVSMSVAVSISMNA